MHREVLNKILTDRALAMKAEETLLAATAAPTAADVTPARADTTDAKLSGFVRAHAALQTALAAKAAAAAAHAAASTAVVSLEDQMLCHAYRVGPPARNAAHKKRASVFCQ